MAFSVRTVRTPEEFRAAVGAIGHYFGWEPSEEDGERFAQILPFERLHAVFDDGAIVAGAGAYPLALTVPGGQLGCACVTVVGVLPTHRRRGLLTRMMTAQLADARERGEPIAALWASEETIYGRYGYGIASLTYRMRLPKGYAALRAGTPDREGRARLVDRDESLRAFPRLYAAVQRRRTGFLARTPAWWEYRILDDRPEHRRGNGPLNRVLLERDGRPVGYALYRLHEGHADGESFRTVKVIEAVGLDDRAELELWRFLFEIDWTDMVESWLLPVDHPLLLRAARINKLQLQLYDGIWMRILDVQTALAARSYAADGRVTLEIAGDRHFPDNVGTWTIDGGVVKASRRRPDVRLDVAGLGSAYLGGFTFAQLARAGQVEEVARGGLARADALFGVDRAPASIENF